MPDGDVFDCQVKRGWKTASYRMIGGGQGPDALPSALRALGKEVKENGCPGIEQIVDTLAGEIRASQSRVARQFALVQLEHVRLQNGSRYTEIAIIASRRLLASLSDSERTAIQEMDNGELRIHLVIGVLAEIADACMCPAGLLHELIEDGDSSFQEVECRRQQSKKLIMAAPETHRMAVQLLSDPAGSLVRTPRFPREMLSQSEILATPLTS